MRLQDRLDAIKADWEAGRYPVQPTREELARMSRATRELIATGQAQRALKAGDPAPHFTLDDADGRPVTLQEMLRQGPLVVSFYRGIWCPYCNADLQALEAIVPEIRARGANLVAISPQTTSNGRRSQRENKLSFPILSDRDSDVAAAFGIRFALPDYLIEVYQRFTIDLPKIDNDPAWVLPMPARYVIGTDGVIAYAEVNPDYTHRPEPAELLPVLDRLRAEQAA
jgi:peroxiredoxin